MSIQASERYLSFEGSPNFRDYGGYITEDGRSVKWRKLFRSGQLASLTDNDLERFSHLKIKLVFDFRRDDERERDPSLFPCQAKPQVVGLPITPGSSAGFSENITRGTIGADEMARHMCASYREFALDQAEHFRTMFSHILKQKEGASLVHCAAGKDRTGFAVAMVLTVLGVPRKTIIDDYMLTARYFNIDKEIERIHKKYQWDGNRDGIRPLLEVRESYLHSAFDTIDQHFSSIEAYLKDVLGLGLAERELLQERYLTGHAY